MKKLLSSSLALASLVLSGSLTAVADTSPDALAYYEPTPTALNWNVALVVGTSFTNVTSGSLGPFGKPCSVLEGYQVRKGDVATRHVYVLDEGSTSSPTVVLNVYIRTDTYSTSDGTTTVATDYVLHHQLTLPLTSVTGATCYLAANSNKVFASTNQNIVAAVIDKTSLAISVTNPTGFEAPISGITATLTGDVFVSLGSGLNTEWLYYNPLSEGWIVEGQNYGAPNGFAVLSNPVNAPTF
jgi:hypothetical protein